MIYNKFRKGYNLTVDRQNFLIPPLLCGVCGWSGWRRVKKSDKMKGYKLLEKLSIVLNKSQLGEDKKVDVNNVMWHAFEWRKGYVNTNKAQKKAKQNESQYLSSSKSGFFSSKIFLFLFKWNLLVLTFWVQNWVNRTG